MTAKIENASKSKGEDEVSNDIEEPLLIANDEGRQISVVAPSNMEEGFTFEAAVDGRLFVVTVPKGGVLMGETIMIPYPNEEDFSDFSANPHSIPTGYWRDGPFDLCVHGRTHPSACCSIICPAIMISQVQTRFWKQETNSNQWSIVLWFRNISPFKRVFCLVTVIAVAFITLKIIFTVNTIGFYDAMSKAEKAARRDEIIRQGLIDLFFSVEGTFKRLRPIVFATFLLQAFAVGATVVIIARTRYFIRKRYNIKPYTPCNNSCDDCLVSFALPCCTAAQIARHTANYHRYEAKPFSQVGLAPTAPPVQGEQSPTAPPDQDEQPPTLDP